MFSSICPAERMGRSFERPEGSPNPRRVIPYNEHGSMPEILKRPQLPQVRQRSRDECPAPWGLSPALPADVSPPARRRSSSSLWDHIYRVLVDGIVPGIFVH